jgi:hypothetical protein
MSFTPTNQLKSNPTVWFRNQQHASRLFVDDQFRLAPKVKYLFHVAFGINQDALHNIELIQRHRNEINMLVKTVEIPKFTVTTETLNQYNRKKVVQYQHKIEPINITFHDDNIGIINKLWQNYYGYYYADSNSAATGKAYTRNATRSSDFINGNYGLDNGSIAPFFKYIKIYQMARHEYVSYTLENPMIASWGSSSALSYAGSGSDFSDFSMSIAYEAVSYGSGLVTPETVEGFGVEHYDQTPSPLTTAKTSSFYDSTANSNLSPSFANTLNNTRSASANANTITKQINTYQNTQSLGNPGTPGLLNNIVKTATQGVGGLQGIVFPVAATTSTVTQAVPINLGKL